MLYKLLLIVFKVRMFCFNIGTARFEKCKELLEYQRLLLHRGICDQCYKTFYGRNLRIFAMRLSVCPWQAFPDYSNKHSSLGQKFINYRQKSFITLTPGGQSSNLYLNVVHFFNTSVN
jgi:hypothetical protein